MAARKKIVHDENTRAKIQASQLINRLNKHILATQDNPDQLMVQSQVTAALGLLKKILPDLSAVELSGEVVHKDAKQISDDELANIAAGSSTGTTEQTDSSKELH